MTEEDLRGITRILLPLLSVTRAAFTIHTGALILVFIALLIAPKSTFLIVLSNQIDVFLYSTYKKMRENLTLA